MYFVLICFTEFEYIVTPISLLVMNENNIIIKVNIMNSKYLAFYLHLLTPLWFLHSAYPLLHRVCIFIFQEGSIVMPSPAWFRAHIVF